MEDIFSSLSNEKFILIFSSFISLYMAILAIMITHRKSRIHRNKSAKEKAYELLLKGNEQQTLDNCAISLIYKREIARKYEYISYIDFLESFLIYVREKDEDGKLTTKISAIINPILEKEKAEKPYSNVKERERRILLAIENSLGKGETSSLKNNLDDLSGVIENNQKALDRARRINNWTVPVSVIGVLLTLFIWLYGSSLSNKDVERISNQIYTSIIDSLNITSADSLIVITPDTNKP